MPNSENIIKLAIADDHIMFRDGIVKILSMMNCNLEFVIQAGNGMELLKELQLSKVLPDIVLLDISMPIKNGYETLIDIRKEWPKLKVLVISMYRDDYPVIKMMIGGANGFIAKSEEPAALLDAIQRVVKGNKYYLGTSERYLSMEIETLKQMIPTISKKEMAFLCFCGQDLRYEEIAHKMGVGVRTIDSYRDNLFKKLNTNSRIGLALFALKTGLVPNSDIC